jgi:hypothetical protein
LRAKPQVTAAVGSDRENDIGGESWLCGSGRW